VNGCESGGADWRCQDVRGPGSYFFVSWLYSFSLIKVPSGDDKDIFSCIVDESAGAIRSLEGFFSLWAKNKFVLGEVVESAASTAGVQ
jgi:hypothetical protein